jgi:hypothetical protein
MVLPLLEEMCNSSLISVTQQIECFVIPLLIALQSNIMEHALEIQVSSNISPHIFNSLVSYVIPIAHFTSAGSDTGNVFQDAVMDIWLVRPV